MKVRGWMIVGSQTSGQGLPPDNYRGSWEHKSLPNAVSFNVGHWIEWRIDTILSVILVCVEVPL